MSKRVSQLLPMKIFNICFFRMEELKHASVIFPKLIKIHCNITNMGSFCLTYFDNLGDLVIESNEYKTQLKEFLQNRGLNLTSLTIKVNILEDELIVYDILEYCPNLKHLAFYGIGFNRSPNFNKQLSKCLYNLEKFECEIVVTTNLIEFILKNCNVLKV